MFSKINHTLKRSILSFNEDKFNIVGRLMKISKMGIHRTRYRRDQRLQQPQQNYYESLGIASNSTQSDIKTAYYRLSMQYHPDKNEGCEISAKKFREISQAYEVLGNYRLRKLYDKGIVYPVGAPTPRSAVDIEITPDDSAETKFYKSRFKKTRVADVTGRTSIYNFDEWSRAHYGETFNRRQQAKAKYDREVQKKEDFAVSIKVELTLLGVLLAMFFLSVLFSRKKFDEPHNKKKAITDNYVKETHAKTTTSTSFK